MLLDADDSQLVLVDYQTRLMPAMHESTLVLGNALRLVRMAELLKVPVVATAQNPDRLGPQMPELEAALEAAGAQPLSKIHFSAVPDGLSALLRPVQCKPVGNARSLPRHLQRAPQSESGRQSVVVAGCEAHVCLLQTALDLLAEEFEVWVVTDACSSRTERNRDAAFDRLASAGAELVTTEMVAFEWLRTAGHPAFKVMQALIK
ncbi:MAG: isochorismatase family protein [Betaproteobacteria bacterium]|nr:isochorismatase family protein [Betaproteobacteria bacterium]